MSRHTKPQYDDVARLINDSWPEAVPEDVNEVILFSLANKFADLFAADNPAGVYCGYCGIAKDKSGSITCRMERGFSRMHSFYLHNGFDREQFLAACGLEPEPVARGDS